MHGWLKLGSTAWPGAWLVVSSPMHYHWSFPSFSPTLNFYWVMKSRCLTLILLPEYAWYFTLLYSHLVHNYSQVVLLLIQGVLCRVFVWPPTRGGRCSQLWWQTAGLDTPHTAACRPANQTAKSWVNVRTLQDTIVLLQATNVDKHLVTFHVTLVQIRSGLKKHKVFVKIWNPDRLTKQQGTEMNWGNCKTKTD